MKLIEARWDGVSFRGNHDEVGLVGAEVRFRWYVVSAHRQPARTAAERWRDVALKWGASLVELEEILKAEDENS